MVNKSKIRISSLEGHIRNIKSLERSSIYFCEIFKVNIRVKF